MKASLNLFIAFWILVVCSIVLVALTLSAQQLAAPPSPLQQQINRYMEMQASNLNTWNLQQQESQAQLQACQLQLQMVRKELEKSQAPKEKEDAQKDK